MSQSETERRAQMKFSSACSSVFCQVWPYLLYECGSFKVLNGLLTELCLDVIRPEPLNHIDVGGEVPEGLSHTDKV